MGCVIFGQHSCADKKSSTSISAHYTSKTLFFIDIADVGEEKLPGKLLPV